ncbi:hypothetical protein C8R44DRAFT_31405 [Mycena epipterygia]|nr:hypothetical protein C8R44DRAFT_31405 [Mycena epipterygia]
MLELPGELVDSIIDRLKSDKSALTACSLVSKQWLPRSRHHRFSSVCFLINWDSRNRYGAEKFHRFIAIISSPLVTFIPCVAEVRLTHKWNTIRDGQVISAGEILTELSACGIQPARLYLDCHRHFTLPLESPPAFTSSLVYLHLELDENMATLGSIVDYVCALPVLEYLEIRGYTISFDAIQPTSVALPPRLHTLLAGNLVITDWILSLEPIPTQLTTLGLINFPRFRGKWPDVNKYLNSPAAENIQSLVFNHCDPDYDDVGPDIQNLQHLKHLEIIHSHADAPGSLLHILARLRLSSACRTLETITLSLRFLTFYAYATQDWLEVDLMLADVAVWPHLRRLTLSTNDPTISSDSLRYILGVLAFESGINCPISSALRRHLRECDLRGILDVTDIPIVPAITRMP